MKHTNFLLWGVSCMLFLSLLQSCTNNDYDWDDIDASGQILLPPVLIGSFDTIWINNLAQLPTIPPLDIELPNLGSATVAYEYVFENLFEEDIIDNFFYEGNDVSLSGLVDVDVLRPNSGLSLAIKFVVLDELYNEINEIVIPSKVNLIYGKNQEIEIKIASEYMKYFEMKSARHLKANLIIQASSISIEDKDYVFLKNVVMKSKGLQFENYK